MFDLIEAAEHYPAFLPWCTHARIDSRGDNEVLATIGVQRGPLKMEFTTRNVHVQDTSVQMTLVRGPFKELDGLWTLAPIGDLGLRTNPVQGFIYADGDAKPDHRFGGGERRWAANDWKPGNGLDLVVASLR